MEAAFRVATNTDGKGPSGLSEVFVMRKSVFLELEESVAKAVKDMDHSSHTTVPDVTTARLKAVIAADIKRGGGPMFETMFAAVVDVAPRIRLGFEKLGEKFTCMYTPEIMPKALIRLEAAHKDSAYAKEPVVKFILKEVRYQAVTCNLSSGFATLCKFAAVKETLSVIAAKTPFTPAGAFAGEAVNGFAVVTDMLRGGTVHTPAGDFMKVFKAVPVQSNLNMAIANQKAAWLASRSFAVVEGPSAAASAGAPAAAAGPKTPRAVKSGRRAAKTTPLGSAPGAPRGFSSSACRPLAVELLLASAGKVTLNASADVAAVNFGARQPQAMRTLRRSFGAEPLYGRCEALSSADFDRWTPRSSCGAPAPRDTFDGRMPRSSCSELLQRVS
jgi:hypothetical protein